MKTITIKPTLDAISEAVKQVEAILVGYKVDSKDKVLATLTLEETLIKMMEAANKNTNISIRISRGLKAVKLHLSCRGYSISVGDALTDIDTDVIDDEYGAEAEEAIRNLVLRCNSDRIRYRNKHGVNVVDILVSRSKMAMMYDTLGGMVLGICAGLLVRCLASEDTAKDICQMVFSPLYTLFLTAVKMIVAPLVFFAIASSITGLDDMRTLGRMGAKIMTCYLFTTACAIALAVGMDALFCLGEPVTTALPGSEAATSDMQISLMDTIMNIVPENLVGAFVNADMLQIIFLAILVGFAAGKMGNNSIRLRSFIDTMNDLFGTIISIISRMLPLAIFGSMGILAATIDVSLFSILVQWIAEVMFTILAMVGVYAMLVLCVGRLNPKHFFLKFMQASITALFTSSSNAAMPTSIECCRKMGIQPRVYTFSIPLGATVNMDGTSIFFVTATLFMAGLYGIDISGTTFATFVMTVMLLSVATPGVPGAGTACMLLLFSIVGLPAEAFSILMGIAPIIELFLTMLNVTGDGAVTTAVASAEGALDKKQYNE